MTDGKIKDMKDPKHGEKSFPIYIGHICLGPMDNS